MKTDVDEPEQIWSARGKVNKSNDDMNKRKNHKKKNLKKPKRVKLTVPKILNNEDIRKVIAIGYLRQHQSLLDITIPNALYDIFASYVEFDFFEIERTKRYDLTYGDPFVMRPLDISQFITKISWLDQRGLCIKNVQVSNINSSKFQSSSIIYDSIDDKIANPSSESSDSDTNSNSNSHRNTKKNKWSKFINKLTVDISNAKNDEWFIGGIIFDHKRGTKMIIGIELVTNKGNKKYIGLRPKPRVTGMFADENVTFTEIIVPNKSARLIGFKGRWLREYGHRYIYSIQFIFSAPDLKSLRKAFKKNTNTNKNSLKNENENEDASINYQILNNTQIQYYNYEIKNNNTIVSNWIGGRGDGEIYDWFIGDKNNKTGKITAIEIIHTQFIVGINVQFNNKWLNKKGGDKGTKSVLNLNENQVIVHIEMGAGVYVNRLIVYVKDLKNGQVTRHIYGGDGCDWQEDYQFHAKRLIDIRVRVADGSYIDTMRFKWLK